MTAETSQEWIELLTNGRQRDLTELRLEDLENKASQLADEATYLARVLKDQAKQCDFPSLRQVA